MDQNVTQAISLGIDVKIHLSNLRDKGWEPLLKVAIKFCSANDIPIPNMNELVLRFGRSKKWR